MDIRPIRNEMDYQLAISELERLWGSKPGTPEGDKLDVLATLIEVYEEMIDVIDPPDPIEALNHCIESQDLSPNALVPFIGNEERVKAILERREPLTLEMIRRLRQGLSIPADVLIQPYELEVI
jgi:HTH-type transcriptional regulator / antitoxin HigA